ncbi:MAG: hypothetical protein ACK5PZ_08790, partial [Pirellula sp.]
IRVSGFLFVLVHGDFGRRRQAVGKRSITPIFCSNGSEFSISSHFEADFFERSRTFRDLHADSRWA